MIWPTKDKGKEKNGNNKYRAIAILFSQHVTCTLFSQVVLHGELTRYRLAHFTCWSLQGWGGVSVGGEKWSPIPLIKSPPRSLGRTPATHQNKKRYPPFPFAFPFCSLYLQDTSRTFWDMSRLYLLNIKQQQKERRLHFPSYVICIWVVSLTLCRLREKTKHSAW